MTLRKTKITWTNIKATWRQAYLAKLLRFLPASALFVNNVFLLFILILKNLSQTNKSYFLLPSISESTQPARRVSPPADPQRPDLHYEQTATRIALVFCISSHVQCCSFNIYATIYEDLCCSRIFKKRHVRTWYCNRCLYCVNSYVLSSVLISAKPLRQKGGFSKIMYKNVYL